MSGRQKRKSLHISSSSSSAAPFSSKKSQYDICLDPILSECGKQNLTNPKWFEARNACIYHYLREKFVEPNRRHVQENLVQIVERVNQTLISNKTKEEDLYSIEDPHIVDKLLNDMYPIYNIVMAVPVLLSFTNPNDDINQIYFLYPSYESIRESNTEFYEKVNSAAEEIIKCCRNWNVKDLANRQMSQYISQMINVTDCYGNADYNNTKNELKFLQDSMGIINRSSYVIKKDDIYYRKDINSVGKIDKKIDKVCESIQLQTECEQNDNCSFRKQKCINKQRLSTLIPGGNSYYIMNNPMDTDIYYLYEPLSLKYLIAGNSGIFERKKLKNLKIVSENTFSIVFPPFGGAEGDQNSTGKYFNNLKMLISGVKNFYIRRVMKPVRFNFEGNELTVGVLSGLYDVIDDWYRTSFLPLLNSGVIKFDSEFFITGTSLGGALANLCAFYLRVNGFSKIHFYANGSPRVGNKNFKEFMESGIFEKDSANYVRYINTIKKKDGVTEFETEFDPVCKFPPKKSTGSQNEFDLISDNPILKVIESGLICSAEAIGYSQQPDYEMIPYLLEKTEEPPISADCSAQWDYIHSIGAYSPDIFNGQELNNGIIRYDWNYDALRDLDIYPCSKEEVPKEKVKEIIKEYIESDESVENIPWFLALGQVGDDVAGIDTASRAASSSDEDDYDWKRFLITRSQVGDDF